MRLKNKGGVGMGWHGVALRPFLFVPEMGLWVFYEQVGASLCGSLPSVLQKWGSGGLFSHRERYRWFDFSLRVPCLGHEFCLNPVDHHVYHGLIGRST